MLKYRGLYCQLHTLSSLNSTDGILILQQEFT